jgi:predicted O-methyltransferase YrrM
MLAEVIKDCPEAGRAVARVAGLKRGLLDYQAAWLYAITKARQPAKILEIGTLVGYSAALMAMAAPRAEIVTLNPSGSEVIQAMRNLAAYANVKVVPIRSWDYFTTTAPRSQEGMDSGQQPCRNDVGTRAENAEGAEGDDEYLYDMIFVDGDHRHIEWDLPWFNRLEVGGLMLFHDYSPVDASHPCPPVYEALNRMAEKLHGFDVLIIDEGKTGMAGIVRREGERW